MACREVRDTLMLWWEFCALMRLLRSPVQRAWITIMAYITKRCEIGLLFSEQSHGTKPNMMLVTCSGCTLSQLNPVVHFSILIQWVQPLRIFFLYSLGPVEDKISRLSVVVPLCSRLILHNGSSYLVIYGSLQIFSCRCYCSLFPQRYCTCL